MSFLRHYPFIRQINPPLEDSDVVPLDPRCETVQFNQLLSSDDLSRLASFLENYPSVKLRIYGYNTLQDLRILKYFPKLKRFSLDVFEIKSYNGIEYLSGDLQSLSLGATRTKAISLDFLSRFLHLTELYLDGHFKGIEVLHHLTYLEKLTLRSITLPSLDSLLGLKNLWWLAIKLGGTRNLDLLSRVGNLKYLELWLIRKLDDLSAISEVGSLQYIFLQALRNVESLPSMKDLSNLRRIHLETMKGISDLHVLADASSLEELCIFDCPQLKPVDFIYLQNLTNLTSISIGLGSTRKNEVIAEMFPGKVVPRAAKMDFEFR